MVIKRVKVSLLINAIIVSKDKIVSFVNMTEFRQSSQSRGVGTGAVVNADGCILVDVSQHVSYRRGFFDVEWVFSQNHMSTRHKHLALTLMCFL